MKDKLLNVRSNGWKDLNEDELNEIYNFCDEYKKFLNISKTERETIENCKNIAIENGFKNIMEIDTLKPNDKVYYINKYKNIFLAVIGKRCIDEGLNIIASHADSPRLDLKPNPLYEEEGLAYFKTHYYGGIKKYQWTTIPLSIHGVIVKSSGEKINIVIGEDDDDPIFTITDLLPHLAYNQMEKKMKDGISGENLNVLIGNIPYDKDSIKLNILDMLNKKYNITEIDFISSEIEIVPALKCRDLGLDKSMIAGYAQDDKASVYTSIKALIDLKDIEKTAICVVTDKEEIGSFGNTSLNSNAFDYFISLIKQKINNNISLDQIYINSNMISADVDVAMDPIYEYVFEKNNATFLGKGISISKYSSSSGKDNCSDANAEYVAYLRNIFEKNNIKYQAGEVGKVDSGDGGTFSYVFSNKGMESIDCGIAILSMHSPYEVSSKYDIYTSYKHINVFMKVTKLKVNLAYTRFFSVIIILDSFRTLYDNKEDLMKNNYSNIDEYINLFPEDIREKLIEMYNIIKEVVPIETTEKISWQMPTFYLNGNLVHFAAFKDHISLFPGSEAIEIFKDKFEKNNFKYSKGGIKFKYKDNLPKDLIQEIVKYRVEENKQK